MEKGPGGQGTVVRDPKGGTLFFLLSYIYKSKEDRVDFTRW